MRDGRNGRNLILVWFFINHDGCNPTPGDTNIAAAAARLKARSRDAHPAGLVSLRLESRGRDRARARSLPPCRFHWCDHNDQAAGWLDFGLRSPRSSCLRPAQQRDHMGLLESGMRSASFEWPSLRWGGGRTRSASPWDRAAATASSYPSIIWGT
jgi:hypothetical protein